MPYQGPHVRVTQKFEASPPAQAIENLPPVAIGTAYDVYTKEVLGTAFGIADSEKAWPTSETVVHDINVIGKKLFDFYPAKVFASTPFDYIELSDSASLAATGVTVPVDEKYLIPNTEKAVGVSEAFIPYYSKDLGANAVNILATDLTTVIATGAALATSKIQQGQDVYIDAQLVGTVAAVGSDETKIKLTAPYASALAGDVLTVGSTAEAGTPNCLYDPSATFISSKVHPGDLIEFTTSLNTDVLASITAVVSETLIKFNVATATDTNYYQYKQGTPTNASTINVTNYGVYRLVGFSQNYDMQALNAAAGSQMVKVTGTEFKILLTDSAPLLSKGDLIAATDTNSGTPTSYHEIDTVSVDGTHQIYTTTDQILDNTGGDEYDNNDYLWAWNPKVQHDIVADFRAIRSSEQGVRKRIESIDDILAAFCSGESISVYNEVAYMTLIEFTLNGGNVVYGVNVDAAAASLVQVYGEALEELKMVECYSHAFGTTDGGVNSAMAPYVNEQADPYEAHERIGSLVYDEEDVFLQGTDTGENDSSGVVTIDGGFPAITAGITVSDIVEVFDSGGELVDEGSVTATPTVDTVVNTDLSTAYGAGHIYKFYSNRKNDQAIRIGNLGLGDRRVTVIWPGWFTGKVGDDTIVLPPYYIAAAIAGMDDGVIASQSFTNRDFALPGISNISLNTSSYFRKSHMDEIGGGGIDLMIQEGSISQIIKSRHDLTSNMDAIESRERSITKQADVTAKAIRSATKPYVGKYNITKSLIGFLGQVCSITAATLVKDGIIRKLEILSIKQDENVVDKINFNIKAYVFVAGNIYDIELLVVSD